MKEKINIEETINKAAMQAIKEFDKEKRQEQKKKVFHNTKLLLMHYCDLKLHVENAIDDVRRLETDLEELAGLDKDELYILSIKRSKSRTLIMIAHIDMAMEILKQQQIKFCSLEKYEALRLFFIEGLTYEEISEKLNCGINTPRRWINEMLNKLGIFLFGIEGIQLC